MRCDRCGAACATLASSTGDMSPICPHCGWQGEAEHHEVTVQFGSGKPMDARSLTDADLTAIGHAITLFGESGMPVVSIDRDGDGFVGRWDNTYGQKGEVRATTIAETLRLLAIDARLELPWADRINSPLLAPLPEPGAAG
jgi:hypothetical protein